MMRFILANHSCCLQKNQMKIELQVERLYNGMLKNVSIMCIVPLAGPRAAPAAAAQCARSAHAQPDPSPRWPLHLPGGEQRGGRGEQRPGAGCYLWVF